MQEKKIRLFINYILQNCDEDNYSIISINDLTQFYPKKYKLSIEELHQIVKYLEEREYIAVRHFDNENICLLPLSKIRLQNEQEEENNIEFSKLKTLAIIIIIFCFIFGFIGALLGSFISRLF